ncbi:MAG: nicotinate (nicotinamide) nucleotide adenylyltransferase [Planctomycetes bacterium]|nr:nicotinate (nicotinamide) nucleotide adenylyltransferase [Planctomycetota bacterium]
MPASKPIGLLGGSFDPPHRAHLAMARAVRAARSLERVLLVVAPAPPHKEGRPLAPYEDRLHMVRLAIRGHAGLEASDLERGRTGPSYTVDTLRELLARSDSPLEFIVGGDTVPELPTWREPAELGRLATFVAVQRPGVPAGGLPAPPGFRLVRVEFPPDAVSSTEVRRRVAAGLPVEDLVGARVAAYILQRGLYRGA